jgi:hypothetical protein
MTEDRGAFKTKYPVLLQDTTPFDTLFLGPFWPFIWNPAASREDEQARLASGFASQDLKRRGNSPQADSNRVEISRAPQNPCAILERG